MTHVSFSVVNVSHGQKLGDTPQVVSFLSGRRGAQPGQRLFIFLDFPGASASICTELARTLADSFNRAPGGITSALRLGIQMLSDRVAHLNRAALPGRKLEGSVACALIADTSVIIARAGPAIAFARAASGAFEVMRPDPQTGAEWIGHASHVEVQFDHFTAQIGDVFVLTGARSTVGVTEQLVRAGMSKGDARMVANDLNVNVKEGQMVALVISMDAKAESAVLSAARPSSAISQVPSPQSSPTRSALAAERVAEMPPSPPRSRPPVASRHFPLPAIAWRKGLVRAAQALRSGLSSFVAQMLPEDPPPSIDSGRTVTFLMAAIAVILPIVIGVVVGVLYFELSGEAERLRLRNEAQTQLTLARQSSEPAQVRLNWDRALRLINEYQRRAPNDQGTFEGVAQEAQARLDELSQITRVRANLLTSFPISGKWRIAAASLGVYALETSTQRVIYYVLNAERNQLIGEGTVIGLDNGQPVSDLAWATTANNRWRTEGMVLFAPNRVLEYSSATGRAKPLNLPVNADTTPLKVQAGELYNNTVYLLDTQVGQIWRYRLGGDSLAQGDSYFRSPFRTLQDSLDIAIDGAIYVLQNTGAVLKYFNRQPVEFIISNLPEPLQAPVAIAARGLDQNRGTLLVLDSATGSIVEFTKNGRFIRQFRGVNDEFRGAVDLSLDSTSNTLYVATSSALYNFALPPEPTLTSVEP